MPDPEFDPSKPFEVVNEQPTEFDPSKPFEVVQEGKTQPLANQPGPGVSSIVSPASTSGLAGSTSGSPSQSTQSILPNVVDPRSIKLNYKPVVPNITEAYIPGKTKPDGSPLSFAEPPSLENPTTKYYQDALADPNKLALEVQKKSSMDPLSTLNVDQKKMIQSKIDKRNEILSSVPDITGESDIDPVTGIPIADKLFLDKQREAQTIDSEISNLVDAAKSYNKRRSAAAMRGMDLADLITEEKDDIVRSYGEYAAGVQTKLGALQASAPIVGQLASALIDDESMVKIAKEYEITRKLQDLNKGMYLPGVDKDIQKKGLEKMLEQAKLERTQHIQDRVSDLQENLKYATTASHRKFIQDQLDQMNNLLGDVISPDKSGAKTGELITQDAVDIIDMITDRDLTSKQKFDLLYADLFKKNQELLKRIEENGGMPTSIEEYNVLGIGSATGRVTDDVKRWAQNEQLLRSMFSVYALNKADTELDEGFFDNYMNAVVRHVKPVTGSLWRPDQNEKVANVLSAINDWGLSDYVDEKTAPALLKASEQPGVIGESFRFYNPLTWGDINISEAGALAGTLTMYGVEFGLGNKLSGSIGNAIKKAATTSDKAANLVKYSDAFIDGIKSSGRIGRWAAEGIEQGVNFEITGQVFRNSQDEFDFINGFAGAFAGEIFRGGVRRVMNNSLTDRAMMYMNKVYGEKAPEAIKVISGIMDKTTDVTSRGLGEVAEETAEELMGIWKETEHGQGFMDELNARFGSMSQAQEFAITSFLFGAVYGMNSQSDYFKKKYSALSVEEKKDIEPVLQEILESVIIGQANVANEAKKDGVMPEQTTGNGKSTVESVKAKAGEQLTMSFEEEQVATEAKPVYKSKQDVATALEQTFGITTEEAAKSADVIDAAAEGLVNAGVFNSKEEYYAAMPEMKVGTYDQATGKISGMDNPTLFQFVGQSSNLNSNQKAALNQARKMTKSGESPSKIWQQTGWFFDDADAEWKTEVPGQENIVLNRSVMDNIPEGGSKDYTLGEVMQWDELYEAHPFLKDIKVTITNNPESEVVKSGAAGVAFTGENRIEINGKLNAEQLYTTIRHEVQHSIQRQEGFQPGTSPEAFKKYYGLNPADADLAYRTSAGEVEADNAAMRGLLEEEQRMEKSPLETMADFTDVTPDQRLVINPDGTVSAGPNSSFYLQEGTTPKGAVDLAKGVMYALTNPDVTTPMHEMSHWWLNTIQRSAESGNKKAQAMLDAVNEFASSAEGRRFWEEQGFEGEFDAANPVFIQELFARGFENYLATNEAPTAKLKEAFDAFKEWIRSIYEGITGSDIDIKLSDNIKSVYDAILNHDKIVESEAKSKQQQVEKPLMQSEKKRKLWKSMNAGNNVSPLIIGAVKPDGKIYIPKGVAVSIDDAHSLIEQLMDTGLSIDQIISKVMAQNLNVEPDVYVMMAYAINENLSRVYEQTTAGGIDGRPILDAISNLVNWTVKYSTQLGRGVNALKIFSTLSPTTFEAFYSRVFDRTLKDYLETNLSDKHDFDAVTKEIDSAAEVAAEAVVNESDIEGLAVDQDVVDGVQDTVNDVEGQQQEVDPKDDNDVINADDKDGNKKGNKKKSKKKKEADKEAEPEGDITDADVEKIQQSVDKSLEEKQVKERTEKQKKVARIKATIKHSLRKDGGKTLKDELVEEGLTEEQAEKLAESSKKKYAEQLAKGVDRLKKKMIGNKKLKLDILSLEGENLNEENILKIFEAKYGMMRPDPKDVQAIKEKLKLREKFESDSNIAARINADIAKIISKSLGKSPKTSEVAWGLWYASILSGPETHTLNFLANAFNISAEVYVSFIEGIVTGKGVGYTKQGVVGHVQGFAGKGISDALRVVMDGPTAAIDNNLKFAIEKPLEEVEFSKWNPYTYYKYVGRAMEAVDAAFFASAETSMVRMAYYQKEFEDSMERGYTPEQARKRAVEAANKASGISQQQKDAIMKDAREEVESYATTDPSLKKGEMERMIKQRYFEKMEALHDPEVIATARKFGRFVTFNYEPEGTLGHVARAINNASQKVPILRAVVPFTRIVANVTNQQIDWTPYGFVRVNRKASRQEKVRQTIKAATGTMLMSALMAVAISGADDDDSPIQIFGAGPKDYNQRKQWEAMGYKPYTISVFGYNFNYQFSPLALALLPAGNVADSYRMDKFNKPGIKEKAIAEAMGSDAYSTDSVMSRVAGGMFNVAPFLLDNSFLSGLTDVINIFDGGSRTDMDMMEATFKKISRTMTPLVPIAGTNFAKQMDRWIGSDPDAYEARDIVSSMLAEIPVVNDISNLKPKINVLGEPIDIKPMERFIKGPVSSEEWKLLADKSYIVPALSPGTTNYDMTPFTEEQLYDAAKAYGDYMKSFIRDNMSMLKGLSDDEFKLVMDKVSGSYRNASVAPVKAKHIKSTEGFSGPYGTGSAF